MESQEFTKSLETLRKKLPRGGIKKLADKLSLDRNTIRLVFKGTLENTLVINEAIKLVEEEKASKQQLAERIKAL